MQAHGGAHAVEGCIWHRRSNSCLQPPASTVTAAANTATASQSPLPAATAHEHSNYCALDRCAWPPSKAQLAVVVARPASACRPTVVAPHARHPPRRQLRERWRRPSMQGAIVWPDAPACGTQTQCSQWFTWLHGSPLNHGAMPCQWLSRPVQVDPQAASSKSKMCNTSEVRLVLA